MNTEQTHETQPPTSMTRIQEYVGSLSPTFDADPSATITRYIDGRETDTLKFTRDSLTGSTKMEVSTAAGRAGALEETFDFHAAAQLTTDGRLAVEPGAESQTLSKSYERIYADIFADAMNSSTSRPVRGIARVLLKFGKYKD